MSCAIGWLANHADDANDEGGAIVAKLFYPEESYRIIGACFEVYNRMGCGFLEPVYQQCLEIELEHQEIPHHPQVELQLAYRGRKLKQEYKPDFVCFGKIIVEIKAITELANAHRAQVQNYLHATSFRLSLLVNFGHYPKLEYERIAFTTSRKIRSK